MWARYVKRTTCISYSYSVRKAVMAQIKNRCGLLFGDFTITCKGFATLKLNKSSEERKNIPIHKISLPSKQKVSKEIADYFVSKEYLSSIVHLLPQKILKRKKCAPEALYLVDEEVAKQLVDSIKPYITQDNIVIEVNPGIGLIARKLLHSGVYNLQLYESSNFSPMIFKELEEKYQTHLDINYIDFLSMPKFAFQDKMDNGSRIDNILQKIPQQNWTDAPAVKIVATLPTLSFLRYLVFCIVFQKGIIMKGRPEFYLTMSAAHYFHLTCDREAGYALYRSATIIFQLFFEWELLEKLPRKAFFPWGNSGEKRWNTNLKKIYSTDPDSLYLVKVVPRRDLFENIASVEQLQLLWYFVRHHFFSRKNRVIPHLERWIPGCGARVILKDMNIYTQFGDLTPQETLSLFHEFISWPEFPHCPFRASMDSSFMKMEQGSDDMEKDLEETAANESQSNIEEEAEIVIHSSVCSKTE